MYAFEANQYPVTELEPVRLSGARHVGVGTSLDRKRDVPHTFDNPVPERSGTGCETRRVPHIGRKDP